MAKKTKAPKKPGWIKQFIQSYKITKQNDPVIGWVLLGTFVLGALAGFAIMLLIFGSLLFPIITSVFTGLIATLIVFGRRAQRSAIAQIEGQPGAAASVLSLLRRGWKVDPAIGFTKQQDVVHRVVGPPGIVLIGEGNVNRLRPLLTSERRKHERVVSETPIHEVLVGNDEGQVPLRKLVRHVTKLGRTVKGPQMTDILARLRALDAQRSPVPLPKGPVPTSMKGARQGLRGR